MEHRLNTSDWIYLVETKGQMRVSVRLRIRITVLCTLTPTLRYALTFENNRHHAFLCNSTKAIENRAEPY